MSTLAVTTVTTGNTTTDQTIRTGNTTAGDMIIYSNGFGIALGGNSTTNTALLSPNGHIVFANGTANTLTLTSAGSMTIGGSITFADGSVQSGGWTGMRNRIINGAMAIDQRRAGAIATQTAAGSVYTVDRFFASKDTAAGTFTVRQTPSATETGFATRVAAGFTNYTAITIGTAWTAAIGDGAIVQQRIEGLNISDLAWGTVSAKTVTLSFLVYSSLTGTFSGSLVNSAANRSYPYSYSISVANTWTQISITIPGDQSGTWITTNGIGIRVYWNLGSGSTFLGTANAWDGSIKVGVTGSVALSQTAGATFYITGVQLERGSTASSFEHRQYGTELALCQRYYHKTFPQGTAPAQNTGVYSGAIAYVTVLAGAQYMSLPVYFPVVMRTTPTLVFYNPGAANTKWRNGSLSADSGPSVTNGTESDRGFMVINNPQVAGDAVSHTIYIHATAEVEL